VAVGTASFVDPAAAVTVAAGLADHLRAQGVASVGELPALFKPAR
jgi:hypothetical protein